MAAEILKEFDLVRTEGLWCLVKIASDQEAWVFRKLVNVVQGNRPGMTSGEEESEDPASSQGGLSIVEKIGFSFIAFLLAIVVIWKRRSILRFAGIKLKEISGYKRDQAFRYDNRKPSDDSWEL